MKPSPLSRKIVARIKAAGFVLRGGEDDYYIKRTMAGRHGRTAGQISWYLCPLDYDRHNTSQYLVGSQFPAKEIVKSPAITLYTDRTSAVIHIDPADGITDTVDPPRNQCTPVA